MKEINVLRKRVKNYRVVIKRDGTINVTVPLFSTTIDIDSYLEKIKPWILKNYEKAIDESLFYDIKENGFIYIFGDKYNIKIITLNTNNIYRDESTLYIETKRVDSEYIIKNLSLYFYNELYKVVSEYINKFLLLTNEKINKITIKKMKSAYGKCYFDRREIIISSALIHKPYDFIEAVCLHEVAHLKYHNHQKDFYNLINKYMSDYKLRLKHLKNEH